MTPGSFCVATPTALAKREESWHERQAFCLIRRNLSLYGSLINSAIRFASEVAHICDEYRNIGFIQFCDIKPAKSYRKLTWMFILR